MDSDMNLERLWTWLHSSDEITWQGHLGAGFLGFWPGYLFGSVALGLSGLLALSAGALTGFVAVAATFAYREVDGMVDAIRELRARLAFRRKGLDGFCDFWFPVFGVGCAMNLVVGNAAHSLAAFVATEIIWLIIVAYKRNTER